MRHLLPIILVACLAAMSLGGRRLVQAADWPEFRGPGGQGHSVSQNVPLTWSETEHITWKTPIPGIGWSSPSVAGNQIWLTTATEDGHSLRAIAVDRASGKLLHDVEVFHLDDPGSIHANNSHASPTPLIEGDRVYVHFGAHGTACLSTDGKIVWKTQELKYNHQHGPGGSPVVWQDLLIINCDGADVQYVVALDKHTGQIRWKRERAHISAERKNGEKPVPMAYCTPLLLEIDGRTQLVSLGSDAIVGHDPATGDEIWHFSYSGYSNVSRPVMAHGMLFFSTGFGEPEFHGITAGGQGDVTASGTVWKTNKGSIVPMDVSPLVVGDELYTISDAGVAVCYDAKTGKQLWQKRLSGKFWASPVYADGRIYCLNDSGKTYVLAPGKEYEVLAENQLDGASQASLAIVDGAIFLRTDKNLYRIEN
jgi:outer membrane protein assembly factor BamB